MMNLHPDVLDFFGRLAALFPPQFPAPQPASSVETARAAHRTIAAILGPARAIRTVRNFAVPGPLGEIACRLYSDRDGGSLPVLIYLHGGGWIGGDLDTHEVLCRELAHGAGCGVVAVDYCLAPENKFPMPFEDCLAACAHVLDHAADFDFDPARIAIGGDSAGGNLAAAVVQSLHRRNGNKPNFQLLIYPLTDFRMGTPAFDEMQPPAFTATEGAWCADQYLRSFADIRDIRASPGLAADLSGLPPAFVMTAEFDPLRDDGEAYAFALVKAGVPVQLRRYPGMTHGFLSMPLDLGVTASGINDVCKVLRGAFAEDDT
jgi:acetyl esterase